jgi:hypothetical protein
LLGCVWSGWKHRTGVAGSWEAGRAKAGVGVTDLWENGCVLEFQIWGWGTLCVFVVQLIVAYCFTVNEIFLYRVHEFAFSGET